MAQLETPRGKLDGKKVELVQELRRLLGLISSRGSVDLKVDLRLGKSTDRTTRTTQPLGNALRLLGHLAGLLLGSALEATEVIVNTVAVEIVVPHRGSSPEATTEAMTTTAVTAADTADMVATEVEDPDMEVTVRLLEARLPGCNHSRTQATVLQAWTAMALHRRRRRLHLVAFPLPRRLAISPRLLRPHHSSGIAV